jgi:hypothetical protein
MSVRTIGIATLCLALLFSVGLYGQTNPPPSRSDRISQMSKQLHWKDGPGYDQYLRTKDAMTNQIFAEVDGFITDSIQPNMTVNQVTAALDGLLNHHQGSGIKSTALTADLPNGSFLIVGVDVERGEGAIDDDAISLRAYRNQGGKFEFVAATNDIRSDIPGNSHLCCVYAKALSSLPVTGEFWFIAWAMVPPQSPYTIALRLFTFDGQQFRTLWSPPDIRTVAHLENVVEVTSTGFVVTSAVDSTGGAAHSPDVIIHEQYALSVNGPVKITETQVNRFQ